MITITRSKKDKDLTRIVNDLSSYTIPKGYTKLSNCPEVFTAVDKIADLISNMTLYLMENSENGDIRIENGLSRLVDIEPSKYMTFKQWMKAIVRCLLLEGDGNAVLMPEYEDGFINELLIVPAGQFSINLGKTFKDGYKIHIGNKKYNPSDLVHFVLNPSPANPYKGQSFRFQLKDLADGLAKARSLEASFMDGKYVPPFIVRVKADEETITTEQGRESMTEKYFASQQAGAPWFLPDDILDVQTSKPLSLKDIALSDSISSNKKTIAGILGVPAFLLGEGTFNRDEYNTFIKDKVLSVAHVIEQTLTKQLLVNPNWYFKFNIRSLYSYDFNVMASTGAALYDKGILTGNEVRGWLDLSPKEGLDELIILENYIPAQDIGNQKKLNNGGENETETDLQSDDDSESGN